MENQKKSSSIRPKYVAVIAAPPPLKQITICSNDTHITEISLQKAGKPTAIQPPLLLEAVRQMRAFLSGERRSFELPLKIEGTKFQAAVWQKLRKIPFGKLKTYTELAVKVGNPKACRAVGSALGKNPFPIVIPCHRVVAKSGLGGFTAGLPVKRWLLKIEQSDHLREAVEAV